MRKYHIQPGDKYGRLTCTSFSHIGKHNRSHFVFRCDCGNEKIILGSGVISGNTKSCGCYSKDQKQLKRLPDNAGVIAQIILQYKRHAKDRDIEWVLGKKEVESLIFKDCFYCGIPPSNKKVTKNYKEGLMYNGIDRINSMDGYFYNNTVPCCKVCNYAKSAMSLNEFSEWAKRLGSMADQWGQYLNLIP